MVIDLVDADKVHRLHLVAVLLLGRNGEGKGGDLATLADTVQADTLQATIYWDCHGQVSKRVTHKTMRIWSGLETYRE